MPAATGARTCVFSWGGADAARGWRGVSGGAGPVERVHGELTERVAALAASRGSLALDSDGRVFTWGFNDSRGGGDAYVRGRFGSAIDASGQLGRVSKPGVSAAAAKANPGAAALPEPAVAIASGRYHALAVGRSGAVVSWGLNDHGQLGRAARSAASSRCREGPSCHDGAPRAAWALRAPQLPPVRAVVAGRYFSVAVTHDGRVFAWGRCACGREAGGPLAVSRPYQVRGGGLESEQVSEASAGYAHLLLRTARGALYSCASGDDGYAGRLAQPPPPNEHGELGRLSSAPEATQPRPLPPDALGGSQAAAVAAGRCASFAVDTAGTLHAWGCAQSNGLAPPRDRATPAPLLVGRRVGAVAAGEYHALAALRDGSVLVWGAHARSQTPVPLRGLPAGRRVLSLAAGYQHALALLECTDGESR